MDAIPLENQETKSPRPTPVVLLLLDGWGIAPAGEANAIMAAKIPTWSNLIKEYPVATLAAGNKSLNTRYLTIGAGRDISVEDEKINITLTTALAAAGLKQKKIAETERLAALTYFFNGGQESKAAGEDWQIITSAATGKNDKLSLTLKRTVGEIIKTISSNEPPDFIVAVLPYLDLVAARGEFLAVKQAAETVDKNLKKILAAIEAKNGLLIISAAAGNAEKMLNLGTELADTEITANPVPLLIIGKEFKGKTIGLADAMSNDLSLLAPAGTLADIAPTILHILGIEPPLEMSGKSLLKQPPTD